LINWQEVNMSVVRPISYFTTQ